MNLIRLGWISALSLFLLVPASALADPPAQPPAASQPQASAGQTPAANLCHLSTLNLTPFILDVHGHLVSNPIYTQALLPLLTPPTSAPQAATAPTHDPADDVQGPAPASAPSAGAGTPGSPGHATGPGAPHLAPLQPLPPAPASLTPTPATGLHLAPSTDQPGVSLHF